MPAHPLKILIYSHDTFGLGHIRRCLAIARSLRHSPANILILSGSPLVGRFKIPTGIDFVRIPGMIKVTNERYLPLSIKLEPSEVLSIRKNVILATAMTFKPDFFIVDKAPLGLKREAMETLCWLKDHLSSCTSILGLRDIMDSAASTVDEWRSKGIYEAMDELYDEIWIYGSRELYDPIREYRIPPDIASKMHFTGYIPRKVPSPEQIGSTRANFGIEDDEKLILVTPGGGGDGHPMLRYFLEAFAPSRGGIPGRTRVVIVTGPFISEKNYQELVALCNERRYTTLRFHRGMESLIGAAQVVVSMGGYNTICEIASQKKPFLIIPRTVPREEQLIRAAVLSSNGFCDYIDPRRPDLQILRGKILKLLDNGVSYREKMATFPFMAFDVIRERILQNRKGNRS
ncbi:MAG: glycosyltransferase [Syntrophobacteraceae bacterium]|nr:glycosyltransferase [Desulfobacteraceae bacterium]